MIYLGIVVSLMACALPETETPPEVHKLPANGLRAPTENSTGVLNVFSSDGGLLYRDADGCFILKYGSVNKDTPTERVVCPDAMLDPVWHACHNGQVFRDESGECVCHTMSPPDSGHPRPVAEAPTSCPPPALIPDTVTVPPPDHIGRLNPVSARHGTVYRDRDGRCIVDGPLPPGTVRSSGSYLNGLVVPCPDGMFEEDCVRSHLNRLEDGSCVCVDVEGDPPAERARPFSCPRRP